jgi:hypothetical protein
MQTKKAYKVKPLQTKEEVLRKLLLKFANEECVAPELFSADFSVEAYEKEYIGVSGEGTTTFSCSVGYRRKETGIEWQAFSGTKSGKVFKLIRTDGERDVECIDNTYLLEEMQVESFDKVLEVNDTILSSGQKALAQGLNSRAMAEAPGDEHKDFSGHASVTVTEATYYAFPYYKISYVYKGKTYTLDINGCEKDFKV